MQNIIINKQLLHSLISLVLALLFFQIMRFLDSTTHFSLFRVFGAGSFGVATLKTIMYIAFIYGVLEIYAKLNTLKHENQGFDLHILPEQDQLVLSAAQVETIKLAVLQQQKNGVQYVVLDFIKKAATQFRNDQNISDTMQVLESQFSAAQDEHEGKLETIRYLISTIPMLGFVGTIVELTAALVLIKTGDKTDIANVREAMSGAFDATVVALVLTMFLTFFYHKYIGDLDVFYSRVKGYIVDNLISRIYKAKA
jgi:chemotaxis protein MotA